MDLSHNEIERMKADDIAEIEERYSEMHRRVEEEEEAERNREEEKNQHEQQERQEQEERENEGR